MEVTQGIFKHLSFFQEIYKSSLSFAGYTIFILKEKRTVQ